MLIPLEREVRSIDRDQLTLILAPKPVRSAQKLDKAAGTERPKQTRGDRSNDPLLHRHETREACIHDLFSQLAGPDILAIANYDNVQTSRRHLQCVCRAAESGPAVK